jgi:hypothetical protein
MSKGRTFANIKDDDNEDERDLNWRQRIRLPLSKAAYDYISAERNMQSDSLEERMNLILIMMASYQIQPEEFKEYLNRKWMK